jgi:hypothetical protein
VVTRLESGMLPLSALTPARRLWGPQRRGHRISGNMRSPVRTDDRGRGARSAASCRSSGRKQSRSESPNRKNVSSWVKTSREPQWRDLILGTSSDGSKIPCNNGLVAPEEQAALRFLPPGMDDGAHAYDGFSFS